MADSSPKPSAHRLAAMLAGSWRCPPSAFEFTARDLEETAPFILKSGAGALCWRRVRHSDSSHTPAAGKLQQAHRQCILQDAFRQRTIEQVLALLSAAGVSPVLVKGWAAARLYPEDGLRPYGDIDLCVHPEKMTAARFALKSVVARHEVDLHSGFEKFGGGSFEEIYARTQLVNLGETQARVPCAEDHLRVLSIHMLREGAWRPLWLCDIAALVESRPEGFDWNLCLGGNRRWSDLVLCALRLAHALLDADINHTPAAENSKQLPRWLVAAVLKEWESLQPSMKERHRAPMASYRQRPANVLAGFRHRWPNPIEATVHVGGRFNALPRLPYQIGSYLARGSMFAARLPGLYRGKKVMSDG